MDYEKKRAQLTRNENTAEGRKEGLWKEFCTFASGFALFYNDMIRK